MKILTKDEIKLIVNDDAWPLELLRGGKLALVSCIDKVYDAVGLLILFACGSAVADVVIEGC